jgi:flagellar basal body rod protein FlgF
LIFGDFLIRFSLYKVMNCDAFSPDHKKYIANQIKNISTADLEEDMNKLVHIGKNAHSTSSRSRIGNNVVEIRYKLFWFYPKYRRI